MPTELTPLPIDSILPSIVSTLAEARSLVVVAEPGAGKTTRIPRALLEAAGANATGEIVVLEPRRLAARLAAKRVADELGEAVGGTVGYQVRFEEVASAKTRIRFVTEGILTRRLLGDGQLSNVSTVLLDEFHERHLHGDTALALLKRLQATTRPDLRLIVMSATLDADPVAAFLGAPIIHAKGRVFPVEIEHAAAPDDRALDLQVASAIRQLTNAGLDGDVLVFLPGAGEIRRAQTTCAKIAEEANLELAVLHGDLPPAEQDRAVRGNGPNGRRKIILSTNVAESSVTVEGIVAVIDGGLARRASHASWSGLPRLTVEKISRASATQRAGRAGRMRPGKCVRLYTKADHDTRPLHDSPEIARADLAQLRLELRAADAIDVPFLEPAPEASVRAADTLLERLGAIAPLEGEDGGKLLERGRAMLRLPLHPRIARLFLEAESRGAAYEGAIAAALLGERPIRRDSRARFDRAGGAGGRGRDVATEESDLVALVDLYKEAAATRFSEGALRAMEVDSGAIRAVSRAVDQLTRNRNKSTKVRSYSESGDPDEALRIAALAGYPDRVAKRRGSSRDVALAGGGVAELSEASAVRDAQLIVALDVEAGGSQTSRPRISMASAIEPDWLLDLFADRLREVEEVTYLASADRVEVKTRLLYDAVVIDESRPPPDSTAHDEAIARVLADVALEPGWRKFLGETAENWVARVRFASGLDTSIPPLTDEAIKDAIREAAHGKRRLSELRAAPLFDHLSMHGGHATRGKVEALAPDRIALPSGRSAEVHYEAIETGKPPWLASYLQDFFGWRESPKVGQGRVPLVLHLLAPNRNAVQVTQDLAGFWQRHYPAIRKELARNYPKHAWPDDPHTAIPMRFGKPRS